MHRNTDITSAKYHAMVTMYVYNVSRKLGLPMNMIPKAHLDRVGARLVQTELNGWLLEITEPKGREREEAIAHMKGWGADASRGGKTAQPTEDRPPIRKEIQELEPLVDSGHDSYELGLDPMVCKGAGRRSED